jgi:biopolymer transport protein ExbD
MEEPEMNVAALIDMVFLLLVFFMSTASLVRSEADLGIKLPGMLSSPEAVDLPDEQIIEIKSTGHVILNDREFDTPDSVELPQLVSTLTRYRLSSEASGNKPLITILADDDARHQRVIDVMNACANAGVTGVSFSLSEE